MDESSARTDSQLTSYFERSDRAFFHESDTKAAIVKLAQADSLVIYCGSGVTIDRTGATWGKLIADLMGGYSAPGSNALSDIAILGDKLSPAQLASILYQVRLREIGDRTRVIQSLAAKLHTILYESRGWEAGVLVRNIIRLAVAFLSLRKKVVIVTSNYDDYLEREYWAYKDELAEVLQERNAPPLRYPGLRVTAIDHADDIVNEPSGTGSIPQLGIVYLHGRVDSSVGYQGRLVLSEQDYHSSRDKVVRRLCALFRREGRGLLIVGSSLTDTPLLAALAETATRANRYALLSAESTHMTDVSPAQFGRLQEYLAERGHHFGVEILMPDFHYQVAQFCLEVLMACDDSEYASDDRDIRYGKRLLSWWSAWNEQDTESASDAAHSFLLDALLEMEATLLSHRAKRVHRPAERFKLELWSRFNPDGFRGLCLWASSAGTLRDRRILRYEELSLNSPNASVRAFIEGRPQHVSLEQLAEMPGRSPVREEAVNSRWRSFLSVPIRLDVSRDNTRVELPVGVVTLASTADKKQSMIPANETKRMEELVKKLFDLGQHLLRV